MIVSILERPLVVDDPFAPLDAIVVLGAPLGPRGELTPALAERVAAAAELYRRGAGKLVVATGGITRGAVRAEADAIAEALRARDVPVLVEGASQTTAENARYTAAILRAHGARTAWLVSQPFHGRRARYLFAREGIPARVWHIADSIAYADRRRALRWAVREYGAWGVLVARRLIESKP